MKPQCNPHLLLGLAALTVMFASARLAFGAAASLFNTDLSPDYPPLNAGEILRIPLADFSCDGSAFPATTQVKGVAISRYDVVLSTTTVTQIPSDATYSTWQANHLWNLGFVGAHEVAVFPQLRAKVAFDPQQQLVYFSGGLASSYFLTIITDTGIGCRSRKITVLNDILTVGIAMIGDPPHGPPHQIFPTTLGIGGETSDYFNPAWKPLYFGRAELGGNALYRSLTASQLPPLWAVGSFQFDPGYFYQGKPASTPDLGVGGGEPLPPAKPIGLQPALPTTWKDWCFAPPSLWYAPDPNLPVPDCGSGLEFTPLEQPPKTAPAPGDFTLSVSPPRPDGRSIQDAGWDFPAHGGNVLTVARDPQNSIDGGGCLIQLRMHTEDVDYVPCPLQIAPVGPFGTSINISQYADLFAPELGPTNYLQVVIGAYPHYFYARQIEVHCPKGADYSTAPPDLQWLKNNGYDFVIRYVGGGQAKQISASEALSLRLARLGIVLAFQGFGHKGMLGGAPAGIADAHTAVSQALAAGAPRNFFCYFTCDFDAQTPAELSLIKKYLDGAACVMGGVDRIGFYGGYGAMKAVLDAGKASKGWQTFIRGDPIDPRICLYQRVHDLQLVKGQIDINDRYREDIGEWFSVPEPPIVQTPAITPNGGKFKGSVRVALACATPGASITYTVDGKPPDRCSHAYTGPFTLLNPTTVKAQAFAPGLSDSFVVSATFTTLPRPPAPRNPYTANLVLLPGTVGSPDITGLDGGPLLPPSNGVIEMQIHSTEPQAIVQVSEDLLHWTDAATLDMVDGEACFSDEIREGDTARFYRLKQ